MWGLWCDPVSATSQLLMEGKSTWSDNVVTTFPLIPATSQFAPPRPKMLSRLLSTTFQIGQGLNWNSSPRLIMARIRIVNYGDCQESIVALRKCRGLSALTIERSHYRDRYHRKSHYQPAPEGLRRRSQNGGFGSFSKYLFDRSHEILPAPILPYPILSKYSQPTVPRHLASLQLGVATDF